jgi:hypothetical protein
MEINTNNLESALGNESKPSKNTEPQISKEEEIGHHKGSLNTLVGERNELFKMIQNVEAFMQMHIKRLEELGVKIEKEGSK